MINSELLYFKEEFGLDDNFTNTIQTFFDKLVDFGYIGKSQKHHLMSKLNENIDELFIGKKDPFDFKNGYYDANRKILYIKDANDIASIYLRLLYVIFSSEINESYYLVGFGTSKLGTKNYKLIHKNFALNRAVFSNMVCTLLGTMSQNIKITTSYSTYSKDFFGQNITSTNNIYFLEGKILSELCFALDINENLIYTALFSHNPIQELSKIFTKAKFDRYDKFLSHFDLTSRKYSNYCKLNYFSTLLNTNYIELRKNVLNGKFEGLKKERERIMNVLSSELDAIATSNEYVIKSSNTTSISSDIESEDMKLSLNEIMEKLQADIIKEVIYLQNTLADKIITSISYMSPYKYACKLKQFNNMLIIPNNKVSDAIFNTIVYKLMPDSELTAVNIIQKIRYSLINSVLFSDKYTEISKKLGFYLVPLEIDDGTSSIVIVNANNNFAYLAKISSLNSRIRKMDENCEILKAENLNYLLNSDFSNMYINDIEKMVSALKESFPDYRNASLGSMYLYSIKELGIDLLVVNSQGKSSAFTVDKKARSFKIEQIQLTDYFSLFYGNPKAEKEISLLPTTYKKKKSLFKQ